MTCKDRYFEIESYLDKNYHKYKCFNDFKKNDPWGFKIMNHIYLNPKIKTLVFNKYWKKQNQGYTLKECIEVAKKCSSRVFMENNYGGYYDRVLTKKWNDRVFKYIPKYQRPVRKYSFKECCEKGSLCSTIREFSLKYNGYYLACKKNNWLSKIFKKYKKPHCYSFKECQEIARLYITKKEFGNKNNGAYRKALRSGWINKICSHMKDGVQLRAFSFENIKHKALKCKTRREFAERFPSEYERARKKGWLNKVCKDMIFLVIRRESKLYRKIDKYLKGIKNLKVLHKQSSWKQYRSIPDYIVEYKGMVFILEVKSEKYRSNLTPSKMYNQQEKYDQLGHNVFKNYKTTIFCSDKGNKLFHYNELEKVLMSFLD